MSTVGAWDGDGTWDPCLAGIGTRPATVVPYAGPALRRPVVTVEPNWTHNDNPDYLHHDKEHPMGITPGELRGRLQPTILLRMLDSVAAAPGNTDTNTHVFVAGMVVFAQYIGNGRLILTPLDYTYGHGAQVVMASALNTTAEIIPNPELANAFIKRVEAAPPVDIRNGKTDTPADQGLASGMVGF